MTPTRLYSKLLLIVPKIEYIEPYTLNGCGFEMADPVEMEKPLAEWAIATTVIDRSGGGLYEVNELTFPLADEAEGAKRLAVWGKSAQEYVDTIGEYVYMEERFRSFFSYEQLHEEEIKIKSTFQNNVNGNKSETIAISDSAEKKWNAHKEYVEMLDLNEEETKKIYTYKQEEISVKDKRMRATMNGVLSNVSISEGAESYEDFQRTADKVAGYTSFIEFKVGDYEYQDAIYRLTITRKNLNAETLIYDYAVHVDIPDTFDRGESAVSGETNIYFNKHYYHAPEVNVTVTGGTEILIPRIITLNGKDDNGRYFTVILENSAGESKSGRISWSARGY